MKFAIAPVTYWDSIGFDTTEWRKSLDGTKAICHLEYAEKLGANLHANPQVQIIDSVDPNLKNILESSEWVIDGTNGDLDSFSFLTKLNQFETKVNDAVAEKVAINEQKVLSVESQLQQTYYEATRKKELEDLSPSVLSAIDGSGGPFSLLSIPQDYSVEDYKYSDHLINKTVSVGVEDPKTYELDTFNTLNNVSVNGYLYVNDTPIKDRGKIIVHVRSKGDVEFVLLKKNSDTSMTVVTKQTITLPGVLGTYKVKTSLNASGKGDEYLGLVQNSNLYVFNQTSGYAPPLYNSTNNTPNLAVGGNVAVVRKTTSIQRLGFYFGVDGNIEKLATELGISDMKKTPSLVTVSKNGGDYETIQSAINAVSSDTTILVLPGVYNENVKAYGKKINILGINRKECILINEYGENSRPPLEASSGTIKSMTLYAKKPDGYIESDPTVNRNAYAIHSDTSFNANNDFTVYDCTLISDWTAAVGIGTRVNNTIKFVDCEIISNAQITQMGALYADRKNGAFLFHDANPNTQNGDNQRIIIDNCKVVADNEVVLFAQSLDGATTNKLYFSVYNSMFYSKISGKESIIYKGTPGTAWSGNNIYLTDDSYGNNIPELNP